MQRAKANNLKNTGNNALKVRAKPSDWRSQFTAMMDSAVYSSLVDDGYGLTQWTFHTRKQALLDFSLQEGTSIGDLAVQLFFLWRELSEEYTSVLSVPSSSGLGSTRTGMPANPPTPPLPS